MTALSGKTATIGSTNGLGRAFALEFISKGAEEIVVGRTFRGQGVRRFAVVKTPDHFLPSTWAHIR